jgi:hypothetical protein
LLTCEDSLSKEYHAVGMKMTVMSMLLVTVIIRSNVRFTLKLQALGRTVQRFWLKRTRVCEAACSARISLS